MKTTGGEQEWDTYYLGLSLLGSFLFIGAAFQFPLFTLIPTIVVVVLVLVAF